MSVSVDSGAPLQEESGYLVPTLSPLPEGSEAETSAGKDPQSQTDKSADEERTPMLLKGDVPQRNGSLKSSPHLAGHVSAAS